MDRRAFISGSAALAGSAIGAEAAIAAERKYGNTGQGTPSAGEFRTGRARLSEGRRQPCEPELFEPYPHHACQRSSTRRRMAREPRGRGYLTGPAKHDRRAERAALHVTIGGKLRKVVIYGTKFGHLFVLDRVTGEPIHGVQERPMPQDRRQKTWPTQPFPGGEPFVQQYPCYGDSTRPVPFYVSGGLFTPFWERPMAITCGRSSSAARSGRLRRHDRHRSDATSWRLPSRDPA